MQAPQTTDAFVNAAATAGPLISRMASGSICSSIEKLRKQGILHTSYSCRSDELVNTLNRLLDPYDPSNIPSSMSIDREMGEARQALRNIMKYEAEMTSPTAGTSAAPREEPGTTREEGTAPEVYVVEEVSVVVSPADTSQ